MGIARGTNIIRDGLVYGYDSGYGVADNDTSTRFYSGKPTVNVHPHPLDIYAQLPQATSTRLNQERDTSVSSPLGGIAYKMTPTGADPYMQTYNSSTYNLASAASGQTWTASVYVKANRATAASIFIFEANSSGAYTAASANTVNIGTDWQRISITRTFNQSNTVYVQARIDGPDTYAAGDILWFDGYQVEQQGSVTPFANGTRSATASLIDLKRNIDMNVSNVSFNSTGQPTFDGSNDYIDINHNFGTVNEYTFEWVENASSTHRMPIAGRTNTNFYKYGAYSWRYKHGGTLGEFYHTAGATSGWHHWVVTYNGSTISVYQDAGSLGTNSSSSGSADFSDGFKVGYWSAGGGYAFNGPIPVMKFYDKALSATEVTQNYNAYKNRFNL